MNNNNGIPSVIRTGGNLIEPNEPNLDSIFDVGGLLMVFFEDTLKIAEKHAAHANREITQEDLEKGFKVRAIYEDQFWTQQDVLQRALGHKQFLKDNNDIISSIPETIVNEHLPDELIEESGDEPAYTENVCSCRNCQRFVNIEEKWNLWEPEKHYQQILKSNFDSVFD